MFLNQVSSRFHQSDNITFSLIWLENLALIFLAGTPPTISYGSISFVTTAPAAIIAPSPILISERIIDRAPIQTSLPISTDPFSSNSFSSANDIPHCFPVEKNAGWVETKLVGCFDKLIITSGPMLQNLPILVLFILHLIFIYE